MLHFYRTIEGLSNTNANSIKVNRSNEKRVEVEGDNNPTNASTDTVATIVFTTPDAINHSYFKNWTHSMLTNVNASNCTTCVSHSELANATTTSLARTG